MKSDWIERNIEKMMNQIMIDARYQRQMPLSISMHEIARKKFINILKSRSAYWPEMDGGFKFLNIPINENNNLPFGTFVVERFNNMNLLRGRR